MRSRIAVIGGEVWQWDTGRKVLLPDDATELHSALSGSSVIYCTEPEDCIADIPNVLLQDGNDLQLWATDGEKTLVTSKVVVHKRPKPPDYIYTETEVQSVEAYVSQAVEEAIASLDLSDIAIDSITEEDIDAIIAALEEAAEDEELTEESTEQE